MSKSKMFEYKEREDVLKNREMAENQDDSSDCYEEEEFSFDVSTEEFLERFKNYEKMSLEEKNSVLYDLSKLIKDGVEDVISAFNEENIPGFLISSFIEEENYLLFSSVVDCILEWLKNPFCIYDDFNNPDFVNFLFFTATRLKNDEEIPSIKYKGSISLNGAQKLMTIFCTLIENDKQIASFIDIEQFFNHAADAYFNIVDAITKAKILFSISRFLKADLESRIDVNEITPIIKIILLLPSTEAAMISFEEYNLMCEIMEEIFSYSEEFAELFIANISLMDCINNCIHSDSSYKIRLSKLIFSCYLCDTGDITRTLMITSFSWSSILSFIDQESDNVLAAVNKFLTFLVAKRPNVLDNSFAEKYIQTITSCATFKGNVETCRFLSTIVQLDHPIATDYVIEQRFITNAAEFLSSSDEELITSIMEAISFVAMKYNSKDHGKLCALLDEFNEADLVSVYEELEDSDNPEISELAHQFLEQFIEADDDGD